MDGTKLDKKVFVDNRTMNCPFCGRGSVSFAVVRAASFDWSENRKVAAVFVKCLSCGHTSMHLAYGQVQDIMPEGGLHLIEGVEDLDARFFYHCPTSFTTVDNRVPAAIRELISEAEGCLTMNYLTGASACLRKAIYEMLKLEKAQGQEYEDKIHDLKKRYPESEGILFDNLAAIQKMSSNKVHENSWEAWDSKAFAVIMRVFKAALYDIYVVPKVRQESRNESSA